ncbi:unnamed protein product [Trichobilharzia regenti]|nr:unnamed protein product [Trichobilharzia regenti]
MDGQLKLPENSPGNLRHLCSEQIEKQSMRGKHRRMHSEGSARFNSSPSCESLTGNKPTVDWISQSGVRRRKFPDFCLFSDSSSQSTTSTSAAQQSWDINSSVSDLKSLSVLKANHSPLSSHRRSASYGGDYFTYAAHEIGEAASRAVEHAEELVIHLWKQGWKVVHHHSLPHWLKDNDFLLRGHRPQLRSFRECFRSIFRLHTETGNIWTHLIGKLPSSLSMCHLNIELDFPTSQCVLMYGMHSNNDRSEDNYPLKLIFLHFDFHIFVEIFSFLPGFICFLILSISFLVRPGLDIHWQEKMVVQVFFVSAILALGFSWLFHTVYCHSERVGKLFNK